MRKLRHSPPATIDKAVIRLVDLRHLLSEAISRLNPHSWGAKRAALFLGKYNIHTVISLHHPTPSLWRPAVHSRHSIRDPPTGTATVCCCTVQHHSDQTSWGSVSLTRYARRRPFLCAPWWARRRRSPGQQASYPTAMRGILKLRIP